MFKRLVFGAFAARLLAIGALAVVPGVVKAEPGIGASVLATASIAHPDGDVLDVKMKCGSWNNWCGNGGGGNGCGPWNNWCNGGGGGGNSGCINFGGVQLCTNGGGSNCHWYNGVKYCGSGGGGGGGGGDCYWHNGNKYCNFKNGGDCRWHNGQQYCTGF
jgi:hypothetical protein